ncbi:unnamed protein product [Caretta caretta]
MISQMKNYSQARKCRCYLSFFIYWEDYKYKNKINHFLLPQTTGPNLDISNYNRLMAKRDPIDIFIKQRHPVAEHASNSESDNSNVNETEVLSTKRIHTSFTQKYDSSYIQFGFVAVNDGGVPKL